MNFDFTIYSSILSSNLGLGSKLFTSVDNLSFICDENDGLFIQHIAIIPKFYSKLMLNYLVNICFYDTSHFSYFLLKCSLIYLDIIYFIKSMWVPPSKFNIPLVIPKIIGYFLSVKVHNIFHPSEENSKFSYVSFCIFIY